MRISDWSSDVCSSDLRKNQAKDASRAAPIHGGGSALARRRRPTQRSASAAGIWNGLIADITYPATSHRLGRPFHQPTTTARGAPRAAAEPDPDQKGAV